MLTTKNTKGTKKRMAAKKGRGGETVPDTHATNNTASREERCQALFPFLLGRSSRPQGRPVSAVGLSGC